MSRRAANIQKISYLQILEGLCGGIDAKHIEFPPAVPGIVLDVCFSDAVKTNNTLLGRFIEY